MLRSVWKTRHRVAIELLSEKGEQFLVEAATDLKVESRALTLSAMTNNRWVGSADVRVRGALVDDPTDGFVSLGHQETRGDDLDDMASDESRGAVQRRRAIMSPEAR